MRNVYKASVFLAVIGLTLLYFSSLYIQIEEVDIGAIEKDWNGKNVKISGELTDYSSSGSTAFLTVNDTTGSILVVNFDSKEEYDEGSSVNVTGHVAIYKGQLEVIAKEINRY